MDDFEDAFNEASGSTSGSPLPSTTATDSAPANEPADTTQGVTTADDGAQPNPQPADPTASQAPAPEPAEQAADPAKLQQKISTLQGMLTKVSSDVKAEREARLAAEAAAKQAAEQASKQTPEPKTPATEPVDGEDDALLTELRESSPMLAKAIEAMMRRERKSMEQVLSEKYGKTIEQVQADLNPIKERISTQAANEHEQTIESAHPGYKQIVESQDFVDWVRQQPGYVVKEVIRVSKEGTAAEVVEVLNSYRNAVPATKSAPAADAEKDQAAARRELQRKAATGVPSKPLPTTTAGIAKSDFDAAFDEAASTQ